MESAISSALAGLCNELASAAALNQGCSIGMNGVSTQPGHMALILMPFAARSKAWKYVRDLLFVEVRRNYSPAVLTSPNTACFEVQ